MTSDFSTGSTKSALSARAWPVSAFVALSLWFGLVTALLELTLRGINLRYLHGAKVYEIETIWMTPLADVMMFVVAGTIIAFAALVRPSLRNLATVLAVYGTIAWGSITLSLPVLHWAASAALACGLGVVTSQVGTKVAPLLQRVVRRTIIPLAALALAAATYLVVLPQSREARAIGALPPAAKDAPNVLFLILDTVRASSVSLYDSVTSPTPAMRRLAHGGVAFDRAIAPASYTLSSHASFFTGRWPHQLSVGWESALDSTYPTLAERLRDAGYRTAAFSANRQYVTRRFGLARGFIHFDDASASLSEVARNSTVLRKLVSSDAFRTVTGFDNLLGRKSADDINATALGWLGAREDRPYFVFLNYYDAHAPYLPPAPCDSVMPWRHATSEDEKRQMHFDARLEPEYVSPKVAATWKPVYEAAVHCLDARVGDLLATLKARGQLTNTLVILAADHGEEFGEHRVFGHGNSLYYQSVHVPLVMTWTGHIPAAQRVAETVSLRDLPATILQLVGLPRSLPGSSFASLWNVGAPPAVSRCAPVISELQFARGLPASFPVSTGDLFAAASNERQYIRDGHGRESFFDLTRDPTGGVAADDRGPAFAQLRALREATAGNADPCYGLNQ